MDKKPTPKAVREYMAEMGRKGGKHHSPAGGRAAWAGMTPAQRRAEMIRRAKARKKKPTRDK